MNKNMISRKSLKISLILIGFDEKYVFGEIFEKHRK